MLLHFPEAHVLRELVIQVVCLINSTIPSSLVRDAIRPSTGNENETGFDELMSSPSEHHIIILHTIYCYR